MKNLNEKIEETEMIREDETKMLLAKSRVETRRETWEEFKFAYNFFIRVKKKIRVL
jgi:hypothetical protein